MIAVMSDIADQAKELMGIRDQSTSKLTQPIKDELRDRFRSLKTQIVGYAKYGTVDKSKRALTPLESAYFEPAMKSTAANILISVTADPTTDEWYTCIYGIETDIRTLLDQLEGEFAAD